MRLRADELCDLGVDQRLEHHLHARAHDIDITIGADRVEQFHQVRLGQGHRVVSSHVFLGRDHAGDRAVAHVIGGCPADFNHARDVAAPRAWEVAARWTL